MISTSPRTKPRPARAAWSIRRGRDDLAPTVKVPATLQGFFQVVEQVADSVMITDREGIIEYVNPAFEKLTGWREREVLGKTPRVLKSGRYDADYYSNLWETILSGQPFRSILLNKRKDGRPFYWEQTITPIRDLRGKISHFISTARDATERIRAEELKADFVNTLAHDLRTPLASLKEGISQIRDGLAGPCSPPQQEILTLIGRSSDRLARLVSGLLDLSRIEGGRMPIRYERFDLAALAREAAEPFLGLARARGLELRWELPARMEVYADREKVGEVLANLIGNAVKFTERGWIELFVAERSGFLLCRVSDTGQGIAQEDIPKLFGKFQQLGAAAGSKEKGSGLGLAICKALVELHGGAISARSSPGEGASFSFTLPQWKPGDLVQHLVRTALAGSTIRPEHYSMLLLSGEGLRSPAPAGAACPAAEDPVARLILQSLRRTDSVIPAGGRCFIGLPDTDRASALRIGQRIVETLQPFAASPRSPTAAALTCRVVSCPEDAQTSREFLEKLELSSESQG